MVAGMRGVGGSPKIEALRSAEKGERVSQVTS